MKKIFFSLFILTGIIAQSQNASDALRYSQLNFSGTARFMALSGAYGALGADFSSLSQNPAGIGLFRKSEFSITPGMYSNTIESDFYGKRSKDYRGNLSLNNVGFVLKLGSGTGNNFLKMVQLGFGLNKMNQFGGNMLIQGFNNESSLLSVYERNANASGSSASNLDPFSTRLAYQTDLLIYDSVSGSYWVDMPNGGVYQKRMLESLGSSQEMVLSGGANFGDMLYIGATLGFPRIYYSETMNYSESDDKGLNTYFGSFRRSEKLTTLGSGFNFKFGFILKPVEFVRIGAAFHTPTVYDMSDDWSSSMTSKFDNNNTFTANSPDGSYDYSLTTPMRAIGSLAFVIGKIGLLCADYEYIDYSTSRLHASDYEFFDENDIIASTLKAAHNLRIGTEWKYNQFAFRGGTSFYGSPYMNETSKGARMGYSFGVGVRESNYFLDFGFDHKTMKDDYYIYNSDFVQPANLTYSMNQFQLTLGLRF